MCAVPNMAVFCGLDFMFSWYVANVFSEWIWNSPSRPFYSPMLFNFALEYAIRRVQVNQDDLKLNGTHQLLVYADDLSILGGSIHTLKENAALVAATRKIDLEVNADKTKYIGMSRDQNEGRTQSVRIDNSTFERVEEFKY